jgi:hypothetical protein
VTAKMAAGRHSRAGDAADAGEHAARRFLEFFAATIRTARPVTLPEHGLPVHTSRRPGGNKAAADVPTTLLRSLLRGDGPAPTCSSQRIVLPASWESGEESSSGAVGVRSLGEVM